MRNINKHNQIKMQQLAAIIFALLVAGQASANSVAHQEPQSNVVSGSQVPSQASPSSPVVDPAPAQAGPAVVPSVVAAAPVESHHSEVHHEHQQSHHPHQHPHLPVASYYAPAALMQVVGAEQPVGPKPALRSTEQYGQPESASLPPNYKPFGSWGLYIGGNPADGYYTNYYKALSNSVDKQTVSGEQQVKPVGAVSPTAALSPVLRQASSSPYVGSDYYPFAYSPSDLSSASVGSVPHLPVHYGGPVVSESPVYGVSPYADLYASKRFGQSYAQKEVAKEQVVPLKGQQQSRVYVYPSGVGQLSAPVVGYQSPVHGVQHHSTGSHHQVVAYPVPVGSQIVGSQAGVDGAFAPYGVHAFTRYAVKPTVVSQEPSYSYSYQTVGHQAPVYKQSVVSGQSVASAAGPLHYSVGQYGYPVNQLHYSQGANVPVSVQHPSEVAYHGVPVSGVDNVVVERVEAGESKPQYNKPQ